jgi:hypothetical protein
MLPDYPNDATGNNLSRLKAAGNNMKAPMLIEFQVVLRDEGTAKQFAGMVAPRGFATKVRKQDNDPNWDVLCSKTMLPTHSEVLGLQNELSRTAKPLGGYCNSWGSSGNKST